MVALDLGTVQAAVLSGRVPEEDVRDALGVPAAQKVPTRLPSRITAASARMELTIATMTMSR